MKNIIVVIVFLVISCKSHKAVSGLNLSNAIADSVNMEYDSHIYIKTNLKNTNANLIFDTGADGLHLDSVFIAKSKLKFEEYAYGIVRGAGVNDEKIRFIRDSIYYKINNLNFQSRLTAIVQLRPIIGKKADGIIGNLLFSDKAIYVDYFNQKLFVFKSFDHDLVKDFKKIQITKVNNRYFVNASINITKDIVVNGDFVIDLGSGGVVDITNKVAMQNNFKNEIKNQVICNSSNYGFGGASSSAIFTTESITLSDFCIKKEIISYSNNKTGALSNMDYVGIIGNGFFERFDVILDFENKFMYLKPNANFDKKYKSNSLGFGYVDRTDIGNGFIITSLFENSNAEKEGLKLGDIITHINDIGVENLKDYSVLYKVKKNRKIKIKFHRNNIAQEIHFITNDLF